MENLKDQTLKYKITKTKYISKDTSNSLFNLDKPVKPELLEYTGTTIVLVWALLIVWVKKIWNDKKKEN
jgi:hypothetical protein